MRALLVSISFPIYFNAFWYLRSAFEAFICVAEIMELFPFWLIFDLTNIFLSVFLIILSYQLRFDDFYFVNSLVKFRRTIFGQWDYTYTLSPYRQTVIMYFYLVSNNVNVLASVHSESSFFHI